MKIESSKRKIKAKETKAKLIATARRLAQERNFEAISVDSIVEAAGVSKGAFYVHFESKDALAAILISDFVKQVDLDYEAFLATLDEKTPATEVLISLVAKIADTIANTIGYDHMKTLYKSHLTGTIDASSTLSYNREIYDIFTKLLEKGIRQGEFKTNLPVDVLARHCVMALRGIVFEWCIRFPHFDLQQQCQDHFELLLQGIKTNNPQ